MKRFSLNQEILSKRNQMRVVNLVQDPKSNETVKLDSITLVKESNIPEGIDELTSSFYREYPDVFAEEINTHSIKHAIKHYVVTKGPPVASRVRRLSPEKREIVKEEIANLLKAGIITPSSSPYTSPIHIVPKAGPKKFRMVGDYRALNNITQPDRYPLPYLNDFVDKLNGCKYFSKIDCLKGYHQIPMAKEHAQKTAIITPIGLYEYKTMPFGMRNCGNTFQKFIDIVTRGLNCFAYVDDVLIASATLEEHKEHLRALFDRFKSYGIVVNREKCVFAAPELTFLGHLVSNE